MERIATAREQTLQAPVRIREKLATEGTERRGKSASRIKNMNGSSNTTSNPPGYNSAERSGLHKYLAGQYPLS